MYCFDGDNNSIYVYSKFEKDMSNFDRMVPVQSSSLKDSKIQKGSISMTTGLGWITIALLQKEQAKYGPKSKSGVRMPT